MNTNAPRETGARSTPGRSAAPRRVPAAAARGGLLKAFCLAGGLLAALPAAAADAPQAFETPVPERLADAPPAGHVLAPGVTLGGYATLQLLSPNGTPPPPPEPPQDAVSGPGTPYVNTQYSRRPRLDLSHLSGIVWWDPAPAWKVLGEVDFQNVIQLPRHLDNDDGAGSDAYVALDRLYADYRVADGLHLRLGKFLTPIGRWNQDHSDPQTWTVLRPLISESAFPTSATGLMVHGSVPIAMQWVDYQVYASAPTDLHANPHTLRFERALGGRVSTDLNPELTIGLSVSRFTQADELNTEYLLTGMDASWRWRRLSVSGEAIVRHAVDGGAGVERGWFLQPVLALNDRWSLVARLEAYRRVFDPASHDTTLVGVVYRSGRHWVFKAEWAGATDEAAGLPTGLLSSLTWVF